MADSVTREVSYVFNGVDNVTAVSAKVRAELAKHEKESKRRESLGALGRFGEDVKGQLKNPQSKALDEIAKFTQGAGGLVLLDLFARGIERVTEQMKSLRQESLLVKVTWADKLESIAKSVPIYGQIIGAGRELRKEIDGTNAYVEKMARRAKGDEAIFEARDKIGESQAAFKALNLRSLGQDFKAQLIEIKADREKAVNDLRNDLDAKLKEVQNPGQRAKLRGEYATLAIDAEKTKNVRTIAATEQDRIAKNQRLFSISEMGIANLEKEAELQKGGAANEAGRLAIVNDYAKKREEISNLLKKDNLTQVETNLLQETYRGLAKQEREELYKFGIATPRFSGGTASTKESYFNTGVAAAGRENNPLNKVVASNAEIAKYAALIYAAIAKQNPTVPNLIAK